MYYFCNKTDIKERKNIYLTEEQAQMLLITEGAETKNMSKAKHYLYDKYGYDEQKAMNFIGTVKTDIPNVRLAKCKFIMGVTRMAMENQLSDGSVVQRLNKCLKYATSDAHVNEYDQNLNGLSCEEIINKFSGAAQTDLENSKNELSNQQYDENNNKLYKIVPIDSFEDASEYSEYTSWCVTHYDNMYKSYTGGGLGRFYFCLKDGFENVPEEKGENCPLDEYGLSMIAVSVNADGSCNTITCRWNHDNGGNDSIMTDKQLSQIIGRNFYDVFKPYSEEEIKEKKEGIINEFVSYAQDEYGQQSLETIVYKVEKSDYYDEDDDYDEEENKTPLVYTVSSDSSYDLEDIVGEGKTMVFNNDIEPITKELFDDVSVWNDEVENEDEVVISVKKDKKNFLINYYGEYISDGFSGNIQKYTGVKDYYVCSVDKNTIKIFSADKTINITTQSFVRFGYNAYYIAIMTSEKTWGVYDLKQSKVVVDGLLNEPQSVFLNSGGSDDYLFEFVNGKNSIYHIFNDNIKFLDDVKVNKMRQTFMGKHCSGFFGYSAYKKRNGI